MLKKPFNLGVILMLLILSSIPFVSSQEFSYNKKIYVDDESGQTKFGLLAVLFTSANGIPKEDFKGILRNVNVTFSGETHLGVAHLFMFIHPPDMVDSNDSMNVKIDFFYGMISCGGPYSGIIGFVKGIQWSTVTD